MFIICALKGVSRECDGVLESRACTEASEFTEKKEKPLDYFIFNRGEIDTWDFEIQPRAHQLCSDCGFKKFGPLIPALSQSQA